MQELTTQTTAWKETLLDDLDVKDLEATVQRWHVPSRRSPHPSPPSLSRPSRLRPALARPITPPTSITSLMTSSGAGTSRHVSAQRVQWYTGPAGRR
jgi:hypothetical protein